MTGNDNWYVDWNVHYIASYPKNFMIEICDHGYICPATLWNLLELWRMNNYYIIISKQNRILRAMKDDYSGVCLILCSAGGSQCFLDTSRRSLTSVVITCIQPEQLFFLLEVFCRRSIN